MYKGHTTDRMVNREGVVKKRTGEVLLWSNNGAGYFTIGLNWKGSCVRRYVHRVVVEAFLPNPDNLPQVNHLDCDKSNNHVDNLVWSTRSDNILDAHAKGRMIKRTTNAQTTILTKDQVIDLYTAVKRDGVGISEKARQMDIPRTTASSIINKRGREDITDKLDKEFA
jgi:hypothetical protein